MNFLTVLYRGVAGPCIGRRSGRNVHRMSETSLTLTSLAASRLVSTPRLTPTASRQLRSFGYEVGSLKSPCTVRSFRCIYESMRTNRSSPYILKVTVACDAFTCPSSCEPRVAPQSRIDTLMSTRQGAGSRFIMKKEASFVVGKRCNLFVQVLREEVGGPLFRSLTSWARSCASPGQLARVHVPSFVLDLKCTFHQLLNAFAFLQQYPSVVHMDVHLLQVLSRQSTANLPCNAGSASFRPHVVLSDFEHAFVWAERSNNSYVPAGIVPPEVVRAQRHCRCAGHARAGSRKSHLGSCFRTCAGGRVPLRGQAFPTSWSFDAWGLAVVITELSLAGSLLPSFNDVVAACSVSESSGNNAEASRTTSQDAAWRRSVRTSVAPTTKATTRRFNAATSTCVRQHTKQAERQLEEVLAAGPSTFFEYLKRRAAKATRDEFGVPIIDAVEQLSVQGAGLLSQLAAWEPRKRIPPHEALRSTFFDDLDPRCPSHSAFAAAGT